MAAPPQFIKQTLSATPSMADVARVIGQLQTYVQTAFASVFAAPFVQAQLVQSVTLAAGANNVQHTLGRRWSGAVAGIPTAAATLTIPASPSAQSVDPTVWIVVTASAPCTVDFVFY